MKFQTSFYAGPKQFMVLIFPETAQQQRRNEGAEVHQGDQGMRSVKSMIVFDLEASKSIVCKEHPHLAVLYIGQGAITSVRRIFT